MSADHYHYVGDIHDAAERYHRHYDDESTIAGLREDLSQAYERIAELESRVSGLEQGRAK